MPDLRIPAFQLLHCTRCTGALRSDSPSTAPHPRADGPSTTHSPLNRLAREAKVEAERKAAEWAATLAVLRKWLIPLIILWLVGACAAHMLNANSMVVAVVCTVLGGLHSAREWIHAPVAIQAHAANKKIK